MSYVRKVSWAVIVSILVVMLSGTFIHASADETSSSGIQEVKTIWWKAKVISGNKKGIKVKDIKTNDTITIKKGKKVIVTKRNYNHLNASARSVCDYNGHTVRIPNANLKFTSDLCTGVKGDYNQATKEYFVNVKKGATCSKKVGSKYLIWVSLDKQRVNIFTGTPRNWKWDRTFLTSTGAPPTPTPAKADVVNFKKEVYKIEGSKVKYFVEAVGSGFHKWAFSGKFRKRAGKHTISHGCIRLKGADALWMYKNIPEGTRVIIY